ncbi:MAG: helix-turn-helix domain-containing protein, partial [Planctomycetales bacterium]|nr:helix-turn-helix domain-containing protein [Planctomycetales bacterium]
QTQQDEGWLNLTEAAKILGVSNRTLRLAIERGDIEGQHPLPDGPWVINRRQLETPRAKSVARQAKQRQGNPAVPNPNQKTLGFSSK